MKFLLLFPDYLHKKMTPKAIHNVNLIWLKRVHFVITDFLLYSMWVFRLFEDLNYSKYVTWPIVRKFLYGIMYASMHDAGILMYSHKIRTISQDV